MKNKGSWIGAIDCSRGKLDGDVPTVELRLARDVVVKVEVVVFESERCGCGGNGAGRMKDELPLALVVEQPERPPGEEECDGEDECEGFEEPARVD